jgi:hypothetical protein
MQILPNEWVSLLSLTRFYAQESTGTELAEHVA